jgi:hypothetical protein
MATAENKKLIGKPYHKPTNKKSRSRSESYFKERALENRSELSNRINEIGS